MHASGWIDSQALFTGRIMGYAQGVETSTLVPFLAVVALAYVTPGPDWFLVMRHAMRSRRAGLLAGLGVSCGLLVHTAAAALGVAAVLLSSATAFTVLKVVGGVYLIYLGIRAWRDGWSGWRAVSEQAATEVEADETWPARRILTTSFLGNVLNPKAALFFVAVLPQFVSTGSPVAAQILALGLLDVAVGLLWWFIFVMGIVAIGRVLRGRRARATIDLVSGIALAGLGGAVALTARRT